MLDPRSGRPRRRINDQVRAEEPNCWLCGTYIDQALPRERKAHPMSSSIDEIVPVSQGGSTLDRANLHHAHLACNVYRGDRDPTPSLTDSLLAYLVRKGYRQPLVGTASRTW